MFIHSLNLKLKSIDKTNEVFYLLEFILNQCFSRELHIIYFFIHTSLNQGKLIWRNAGYWTSHFCLTNEEMAFLHALSDSLVEYLKADIETIVFKSDTGCWQKELSLILPENTFHFYWM